MFKRIAVLTTLILAVSLYFYKPHNLHAQSSVAWGGPSLITQYEIFYNTDAARIVADGTPVVNGCNSATSGQYITDPTNPGNKALEATLLAAFLAGKKIQFAVQGCSNGFPILIDVSIAAQ